MYIQQIQNSGLATEESTIRSLDIKQLSFVESVMQADLSYLQDIDYLTWKKKFEKYIVFGIGGSSLGGQAIKQALAPEAPIKFYDNIDPNTIKDVLYNLKNDFQAQNTGFLIISKSGETLETLSQLFLVLDIGFSNQHFIVITEDKPSTLMSICQDYKIKVVPHAEIGGRYSVLSTTGLIPADLMGLDIHRLLSGAQNAVQQFTPNNFQMAIVKQEILNEVFFIYSDKMIKFGEWIRQLLAESTGKKNKGITPILAQGAIDQHSQLQLYLGGHADKFYTFIIEHNAHQIHMPSSCKKYLPFLKDKTLNELFLAEAQATQQTLYMKNYPLRTFDIYTLDEATIGHLFMYFMLETVFICQALNINPFDQPHVETGKKLIKKII